MEKRSAFKQVFSTLFVMVFAVFLMGQEGCDNRPQTSTSGAKQIKNTYQVPTNSRGLTMEQQNIYDRVRVTTDPTKVLWIHLIALDGKIIQRMAVRSKVTSSGKRLEPTVTVGNMTGYPESGVGTYDTNELIQPDGTYGHSDPYIFWFDPMGRYHQYGTAGGIGYLLTDYPIDLRNPLDEITGLFNMAKEAHEWQKQQEEMLRKQEGKQS